MGRRILMFNKCFQDHRIEELYKAARGIEPLPEMLNYWKHSMIDSEKQTIWEMLLEELASKLAQLASEEYIRWKDSQIT